MTETDSLSGPVTPGAGALLHCPICLSTFNDPYLLGECGHTFCKTCIEGVQSAGQRAGGRCPTCRRAFRPHQVLPNFALRELVAENQRHFATMAIHVTTSSGTTDECIRFPTASTGLRRQGSIVRKVDSADAMAEVEKVMKLGLPAGLAKLVAEENRQIAQRIFLLDNSGSTQARDGKILVEAPGQSMQWQRCTRWEEIKDSALNHARWNLEFGVPSEFVILNSGTTSWGQVGNEMEEGLEYFMVDAASGSGKEQLSKLEEALGAIKPRGLTPIAERLRRIREQLRPKCRELLAHGQTVVLVIVTDGLPTGPTGGIDHRQLVEELRTLGNDLSLHVVVRLCTDDDAVADLYNRVDGEVELQLDIVDDMRAEAHECRNAGNYFLAYSPELQLVREGGTFCKELDLLDERLLEPIEAALISQMLVRVGLDAPPFSMEPKEFCIAVREALQSCPNVFDVGTMRWEAPVRIDDLEWAVLPMSKTRRECGNMMRVEACSIM